MNPKLILASGSPRRKELLQGLFLEFEIRASSLDESTDLTDPVDIVSYLSLAKAQDVANKVKDQMSSSGANEQRSSSSEQISSNEQRILVLGSDTIVVLGQKILGKPESRQEAYEMLMSLSGKEHKVYSGVSIVQLPGQTHRTVVRSTSVFFRELSSDEAMFYANSDEPMDKAGAYALQGTAAAFVEKVEGCYSNVIGLPVPDTVKLLREYGMKVLGS